MTPDQELMVIFGVLHLVALAFGGVLLSMFMRSETTEAWQPPDDDDAPGGGGNDRVPAAPLSPAPMGGLPLPDADPASVRLRDHRRLADAYPGRERRPRHSPSPRPRVPAGR